MQMNRREHRRHLHHLEEVEIQFWMDTEWEEMTEEELKACTQFIRDQLHVVDAKGILDVVMPKDGM